MNPIHLEDLIRLHQLSTARREQALTLIRLQLETRNLAAIVGYVDLAKAANDRARELAASYRADKNNTRTYSPEILRLDELLDRVLGALAAILQATAELGDASNKAPLAKRLLAAFFPTGLAGVVRVTVVQQQEEVRRIVGLLVGGEREAAQEVGIAASHLDRLIDLAQQMDQELTKLPEQSVGWDDVQAADQAAHRALLRVAGAILVEFGDDSEASVLSRTQLLEPLMDQIEQTRRARRRGRSAAGETTDQTDPAGV